MGNGDPFALVPETAVPLVPTGPRARSTGGPVSVQEKVAAPPTSAREAVSEVTSESARTSKSRLAAAVTFEPLAETT